MPRYASVILPLPIHSAFTYAVPEEMEETVVVGSRVLVPFGRRNIYTGIVEGFAAAPPAGYPLKDILSVLDEKPIVRHPQLKFWNWIADYYLCSPGEVMKAALPAGLKVESETVVTLSADDSDDSDAEASAAPLTEDQALVMQYVGHHGKVRIGDLDRIKNLRSPRKTVKDLLSSGRLVIRERIVDKYVSRKVSFVRLNCSRDDSDRLHLIFDLVTRAPKQERLLVAYLEMSGWMKTGTPLRQVEKKELLRRVQGSPAALKALVDKGVMIVERCSVNRFSLDSRPPGELHVPSLSDKQKDAEKAITEEWKSHNVTLLRGVTGSGKTEIYSDLIRKTLDKGRQALFLVPEISLTTQLTMRLHKIFGSRLLVYHSKFSDNERVDIWRRLLDSSDPIVVLGVRSSVFLPFANLGLVVVDEEHEASYKQQEPAPRYNARDAAIVLASMHGAKVLLGSATPAVETYYKAREGKYGLVELLERYEDASLPEVQIIDMRAERKRKRVRGIYSDKLLETLRPVLEEGRQAIVFQNRRGYAPVVVCRECGWTPRCPDCDVAPVFHRNTRELRCHYCGRSQRLPSVCPACGQPTLDIHGYGTERIADDLHGMLPGFRVARMDFDTTRAKDSYEEIITEFSKGDTQVLVGTQMVSKGLDFDNVDIVAVPNADTILNFPDFRSDERAFNMLEQVSGRAGRRSRPGRVLIQTTSPNHEVLAFLCRHDYKAFYEWEIENRRAFNYPPFTRVVTVYLRHKDNSTLISLAAEYTRKLRGIFGSRVVGPETPHVGRVGTWHIRTVMLKVETLASMPKVKRLLREIYAGMADFEGMKSAMLHFDVDPV